jgi:murein DD-endopeptidase MepM/ murein hydrolase activator NlpD
VLIHDSKISLLDAATHSDPNPNKGAFSIGISEGSALVPSGGPDGALPESVLGTGGPVSDAISLYTVREGDNLSIIADMHGVSVNTIKWANDIKDVSLIRPGDTLLILPVSGVKYTIKYGGTLLDVAKKFDADVEEIALFNGIDPEATLAAGTELIIPGGNLASKPVAKSAGTASSAKVVTTPLPSLTGYFTSPMHTGRVTQGIHGHNGIDVGAPSGTPVYAAAGGTVIVAKNNGAYNGGYGNYVVISHDNGTQTLYAHLSSVEVTVGQTVAKDEHIGGVGNTGRSTGNHLHFEVRGAKNPLAQ